MSDKQRTHTAQAQAILQMIEKIQLENLAPAELLALAQAHASLAIAQQLEGVVVQLMHMER